jgi:tRNA(Arg) A34 adenosine deaminase TadA
MPHNDLAGVSGSPSQRWAALEPAWRECFELAWQSFRSGSVAVGALLADRDGQIVGTGRNRRFEPAIHPGSVSGLLGHAEINALMALPASKDRERGHVLYTTLQPCPMCLGAIVVVQVGAVKFAAADPRWAGIEQLPGLNEEVRERWPTFEGPLNGPIGAWAAILPCLALSGTLLRSLEPGEPALAALARTAARLFREASAPPATTVEALELVWERLTAVVPEPPHAAM